MTHLITGGAGFIGSNLANRLIARGEHVTVYDNLSRPRTPHNIEWLQTRHGRQSFEFVQADLRDTTALNKAAQKAKVIYHLAGQTTVTLSVTDPKNDFECNALGTLNVLEAARAAREHGSDPIVLYSSTNKVYGKMEAVAVEAVGDRYAYRDYPSGIDESYPIDFASPYGCSKGAGDQYVRDYWRIYDLRTVVMRQSSIYGYRQFGIEDQGWIAWLAIAAVTGQPINIFGDGKQVRDILFIDDLLDLYDAAVSRIDRSAGQIYNAGGGKEHTLSIWTETRPLLEKLLGRSLSATFHEWRPGDQLVYISNIGKAQSDLGWSPKIGVEAGVKQVFDWIVENRKLFAAGELGR